jgi:hypothetical protein
VNVLGIDLSSKAIDLVLLDENHDTARWERVTLEGPDAFQRARDVRRKMPLPSWFVNNDVYLVAIERPFVRRGQDVIRLVQGAVLSCLGRELEVWEVSPSQWKNHLGVPMRTKPDRAAFPAFHLFAPTVWEQDAYDALGVALYARDLNAKAISDALSVA